LAFAFLDRFLTENRDIIRMMQKHKRKKRMLPEEDRRGNNYEKNVYNAINQKWLWISLV